MIEEVRCEEATRSGRLECAVEYGTQQRSIEVVILLGSNGCDIEERQEVTSRLIITPLLIEAALFAQRSTCTVSLVKPLSCATASFGLVCGPCK